MSEAHARQRTADNDVQENGCIIGDNDMAFLLARGL